MGRKRTVNTQVCMGNGDRQTGSKVDVLADTVVQGREARVRALISDLEELRGGSQSLSDRILQVIEIVQDINSVRLEDDGPYNYIRSEFVGPLPPHHDGPPFSPLELRDPSIFWSHSGDDT